jgi:SPP1 family predicted phage head-tail adaptor
MKPKTTGAMHRRLTLEAPSRTGDEAASASTVWISLGLVWAAVVSRSAREIVDADAKRARITHEIHLRWRADITAAMRLRDGPAIYEIRGVRDADEKRHRLICDAEELAP